MVRLSLISTRELRVWHNKWLLNPSRTFQIFEVTFEYNELCGVYSYVLNSLELLWYHDLEQLNSSHKHGVVDEDEQEKRFEQFLRLWLWYYGLNGLIEVLCVRIRKHNSYRGNLFEFDAKLSIRENAEDVCCHDHFWHDVSLYNLLLNLFATIRHLQNRNGEG